MALSEEQKKISRKISRSASGRSMSFTGETSQLSRGRMNVRWYEKGEEKDEPRSSSLVVLSVARLQFSK